jgi:hypothetical protein
MHVRGSCSNREARRRTRTVLFIAICTLAVTMAAETGSTSQALSVGGAEPADGILLSCRSPRPTCDSLSFGKDDGGHGTGDCDFPGEGCGTSHRTSLVEGKP